MGRKVKVKQPDAATEAARLKFDAGRRAAMEAKYAKEQTLPGSQSALEKYFAAHPKQAQYLRPMVEGGAAGADALLGATPLGGVLNAAPGLVEAGSDALGALTGGEPRWYGEEPNTTTVPKNVQPPSLEDQQKIGRAGALKNALGDQLETINSKFSLYDVDAETALHNFADGTEGRRITEGLLKGKGDPEEARKAYEDFARKWAQPAKSVDNRPSKTLDIEDPVVIKASTATPQDVVGAVMGAGKQPVVIDDASDYGFRSDRVVVMPRKNQKSKINPKAIMDSVETPVVAPDEFIDVIRMIRGG